MKKKGKNVNISLGYWIYDDDLCSDFLVISPLLNINFDNFMLDPCLDSFTFDHLTIEEVKKIKQFISDELEKIKNYKTLYNEIENKKEIDLDKEINDLKIKMDSLENKRKFENKDDENYYENTMFEIENCSINTQLYELNRLIEKLKNKNVKCN